MEKHLIFSVAHPSMHAEIRVNADLNFWGNIVSAIWSCVVLQHGKFLL